MRTRASEIKICFSTLFGPTWIDFLAPCPEQSTCEPYASSVKSPAENWFGEVQRKDCTSTGNGA